MSIQLHYPPPGCTGRWNCKSCRQAGFVFTCKSCKRKRPWCLGANDDHPNCCNICRHRWHHLDHERRPGASPSVARTVATSPGWRLDGIMTNLGCKKVLIRRGELLLVLDEKDGGSMMHNGAEVVVKVVGSPRNGLFKCILPDEPGHQMYLHVDCEGQEWRRLKSSAIRQSDRT